jgi:hypothetical protein
MDMLPMDIACMELMWDIAEEPMWLGEDGEAVLGPIWAMEAPLLMLVPAVPAMALCGDAVAGGHYCAADGLAVDVASPHDHVAAVEIHLDAADAGQLADLFADGRNAVLAGHAGDVVGVLLAVAHGSMIGIPRELARECGGVVQIRSAHAPSDF